MSEEAEKLEDDILPEPRLQSEAEKLEDERSDKEQ